MKGKLVPSRENRRDSRGAKVRRNPPTSKEKNRKFSTISGPVVDNFPCPPRKRLTFNAPRKIQTFRCVMKHLFVPFCIFRHPRLAIPFTFITFAKDYKKNN